MFELRWFLFFSIDVLVYNVDIYIILHAHTVANQAGLEEWVAIVSTVHLNVITVGKVNGKI